MGDVVGGLAVALLDALAVAFLDGSVVAFLGGIVRLFEMFDYATFFDITISGVGLGALYALVAMGFSLIYKVTGVLNFAQGQLALVGAYGVVVFASMLGTPPLAALLLTILVGVVLGVLLERVVFRHFIGEPVLSIIIVTLALGGMISGGLRYTVGPTNQPYPGALQPDWSLSLPFGASMTAEFAVGVALALSVVTVLMLFFRYTVMGSILRAAASDEQAAMVLGVSIERTIVVAWTISITVTAVGGILLAMASGGAAFTIEAVGVLVFAAVVFGGLDSVPGAFVGAIVVGVLQEWGAYYAQPVAGPGFGRVLPMLFLVAVILVKPYGLFGTERIERL